MARRPRDLSLRGQSNPLDGPQKNPVKKQGYSPTSRRESAVGAASSQLQEDISIYHEVGQFQLSTDNRMYGLITIRLSDPFGYAETLKAQATTPDRGDRGMGLKIISSSGADLVVEGEVFRSGAAVEEYAPYGWTGSILTIENATKFDGGTVTADESNGDYTVSSYSYDSVNDQTTITFTSSITETLNGGRVTWANLKDPTHATFGSGTVRQDRDVVRTFYVPLKEYHNTTFRYRLTYSIFGEQFVIERQHTFDHDIVPSVRWAGVTLQENGDVLLTYEGDEDTRSVAYITSLTAFGSDPSSAQWDAADYFNGRTGQSLTIYTGLQTSDDLYIALKAYRGVDKSDTEAERIFYLHTSTAQLGLPEAYAHTYQIQKTITGEVKDFGVLLLIVDDPSAAVGSVEMREQSGTGDPTARSVVAATNPTYQIQSIVASTNTLVIDEDMTPFARDGDEFVIDTGPDAGTYTCNGDATFAGGQTTIVTNENLTTDQGAPGTPTVQFTNGTHYREEVELQQGHNSWIEWFVLSSKWSQPVAGREVFDADTKPQITDWTPTLVYNATDDRWEVEVDYFGDEDTQSVALLVSTSSLSVPARDRNDVAWDTPDEVSNERYDTLTHVPGTPFALGDTVYVALLPFGDDNQGGVRGAFANYAILTVTADVPKVEAFYYQSTNATVSTPGTGSARLYYKDTQGAITAVRYRSGSPIEQGDTWTTLADPPVTPSDVAGFDGYYLITGIALDGKLNTQFQWVIELDPATANGLERIEGSYSWDPDRVPEFLVPVTHRSDNGDVFVRWSGDDDVASVTWTVEEVATSAGLSAGYANEPNTWVGANSQDGAAGEVQVFTGRDPSKYLYIKFKALPQVGTSYSEAEDITDVLGQVEEIILPPISPANVVNTRAYQNNTEGVLVLTVKGYASNIVTAKYRVTLDSNAPDALGPSDASWSNMPAAVVSGDDAQYTLTAALFRSLGMGTPPQAYRRGSVIQWYFEINTGENDGTSAVITPFEGVHLFDPDKYPEFQELYLETRGTVTPGSGSPLDLVYSLDEDATGMFYIWDIFDLDSTTEPAYASGETVGPAGASTDGYIKGYVNSQSGRISLGDIPANKIARLRAYAVNGTLTDLSVSNDTTEGFIGRSLLVSLNNYIQEPPRVEVTPAQDPNEDFGTLRLDINDPQGRLLADPNACFFRYKTKNADWTAYAAATREVTPTGGFDVTFEDTFQIATVQGTLVQYRVQWLDDDNVTQAIEGQYTFDANREARMILSEVELQGANNRVPQYNYRMDDDGYYLRFAVSNTPINLASGNTASTTRWPTTGGTLGDSDSLTFDGATPPPTGYPALPDETLKAGQTFYIWVQVYNQFGEAGAVHTHQVTLPGQREYIDVGMDVLKSGGDPDFGATNFRRTVVIGGGEITKSDGKTYTIAGENFLLPDDTTSRFIYYDVTEDDVKASTSASSIFTDDQENIILAYVTPGASAGLPPQIQNYYTGPILTEQNLTIPTLEALFGRIETLEITKLLTIETGGEFRAGTGTPGTDFTGFRIMDSALSGYSNDVIQFEISAAEGWIKAGADKVVIDADGISIAAGSSAVGGTGPTVLNIGSAEIFNYLIVSPTEQRLVVKNDSGNIRYETIRVYSHVFAGARFVVMEGFDIANATGIADNTATLSATQFDLGLKAKATNDMVIGGSETTVRVYDIGAYRAGDLDDNETVIKLKLPRAYIPSGVVAQLDTAPSGSPLVVTTSGGGSITFNAGSTTPDSVTAPTTEVASGAVFTVAVSGNANGAAGLSITVSGAWKVV